MTTISIDEHGMAPQARHIASPNCDDRPPHTPLSLIVIHNISLPPGQFGGEGVIELFTNRLDPEEHPYYREIYQRRVCAHFFIRRNGELIQFASCDKRAWHAGVSQWQGRERCNDFSVGIELEGSDDTTFENIQYSVLNDLISALRQAYPISGIAGHSDIARGRKTDPGPYFDWKRIDRLPP
ncbi:MAG TPA: 1,6-anhydro-N-acetylmuramyl-L-alanine amidase AmpD [Novimethylophilus sp.]|jgi:AmpD protein|uniref:1,6-anhydro-N-acetylmuramyl-L-alanine amidase AmpD n=1 Tax=Novimethylophilus sp. TaxID=2137426 RepID=UPI002F425337